MASETFVNFHVRSTDAAPVATAARELIQGRAYHTASVNGWVSLYDEVCERQDAYEIGRLAGELSARLSTAVLAFLVAEGSLFVYYLFQSGDLLDEYNSDPAPASEQAGVDPNHWFSGRPDVLAQFGPPGTDPARVGECLARAGVRREGGFASAVRADQRLRPLARLLAIDVARATTGFYEVDRKRSGDFTRLDGRPLRNPFRGPVPPRVPPR